MSRPTDPHTRSALRRAVRFRCTLDVDGLGRLAGVATDLSARGVWVVVETPLEVGVLATARFRLPRTGRDLSAVAEVARVDADGRAFGMGLRFRAMAPSDRLALDAVLRGLPPRLPSLEEEVEEILDDAEDVYLDDDAHLAAGSGLYAILVQDDVADDDFVTLTDDELERFTG
jgi:hypothetical protein